MWLQSTHNCVVHLVSCRVKLNPPLNVNFYPDASPAYLNDLKSFVWCSSRVSHDFSNTTYTCDVTVLSDDATVDSSRSSRSPPNNLAKGWDFMRQREPWTSRRRAALGKSVQNHHQANDDVRKLITACLRSLTRKHDRTTLSRACPLYMIVSTEGWWWRKVIYRLNKSRAWLLNFLRSGGVDHLFPRSCRSCSTCCVISW